MNLNILVLLSLNNPAWHANIFMPVIFVLKNQPNIFIVVNLLSSKLSRVLPNQTHAL